jgi:asparagine synthase (glutamine-hydrolysing)
VSLPSRYKLPVWQTKVVLREALRNVVPKQILTRRKMGFPVPIGRWLQHEFWPMVEEFVLGPRTLRRGLFAPEVLTKIATEHRLGVSRHDERLWLLINLEIWQRIFIDGEAPSSVYANCRTSFSSVIKEHSLVAAA